ncbi:MAG: hypothetical protein E6J97_09370 [Methanobacteriota archaeon]|nr:MAG: hypothetical protein E6J97_09370 [Euryarchaeota archaeon]
MDEDRGGRRGGGGYDRGPRQMFDAVCADCGQATQVPFKPDPARPVYCRDCFAKRRPRRSAGAELVFNSHPTSACAR